MLAIHNYLHFSWFNNFAANAFAKLSKCQQFTTQSSYVYIQRLLQTLLQSYQNVSNSQLAISLNSSSVSCKRFCKVIKMLAIHNSSKCFDFKEHAANAFAKLSKCQQFTTPFWFKALYQGCKRFCKVIKMLAPFTTNDNLSPSY